MEIFRPTVLAVKMEAPSVMTYHFNIPEGFDWKEGSHLHLAMPDFDLASGRNPNKIRHMSIATQPFEGSIAITTRLTGDSPFKRNLQRSNPGIGCSFSTFPQGFTSGDPDARSSCCLME